MKTSANQTKLMPIGLFDQPVPNNGIPGTFVAADINPPAGKPVPSYILDGVVIGGGLSISPVGLFVEGTSGNDKLYGSSKDDTLIGGDGHDRLFGRDGNDTLIGGNGNDWLDGGDGADVIDGGIGFDTVSFESASSGITIDLSTGFSNDGDTYGSIERWIGSSHMDILTGGASHDIFEGGGGDDWLHGEGGHDTISGGAGDDFISGGDGHDILIGGAGHDELRGDAFGIGADTFVFTRGSGLDEINDFQQGHDHIDVSAYGHGPAAFGADGALATGWFDEDGKLHDVRGLSEGDRFFYDIHTGILWECEYDLSILELTEAIVEVDQSIGRLHADDLIV